MVIFFVVSTIEKKKLTKLFHKLLIKVSGNEMLVASLPCKDFKFTVIFVLAFRRPRGPNETRTLSTDTCFFSFLRSNEVKRAPQE